MADKLLSSDDYVDLFSTEYHEQRQNDIKGIGRGKLKEDIGRLKLPKAAIVKKEEEQNSTQNLGMGRGRGSVRMNVCMSAQPARLPREKPSKHGFIGLQSTDAFPSLQASASTNVRSSKATNSPKLTHRQKTGQSSTASSNGNESTWPSLPSFRQSDEPPRVPPTYPNASRTTEINGDDGGDIVMIQNLPEAILDEDLRELLSLYGNVLICDVERDADGNSLGSAIVKMETKTECEWIISCFHNQEYPGCSGTEKLCCSLLGQ